MKMKHEDGLMCCYASHVHFQCSVAEVSKLPPTSFPKSASVFLLYIWFVFFKRCYTALVSAKCIHSCLHCGIEQWSLHRLYSAD